MPIKDALVLLVDVSPPMHRHLDMAGSALLTTVASKIINSKNSEVAVIFSGTDGTCNVPHDTAMEMDNDDGQYLNITVAHALESPSAATYLPTLRELPRGGAASDWVNGVTVCLDLVARASEERTIHKIPKKVVVVSNFFDQVPSLDADFTCTLVENLREFNTTLEIVCIDDPADAPSEHKQANVAMLHDLVAQVSGKFITVGSSEELLGVFRAKEVTFQNTFAGELAITDSLKVKVGVYKKTGLQNPTSFKNYSDRSTAEDASHKVERDTVYKLPQSDEVVGIEDLIPAFRYGKQSIPLAETSTVRFYSERAFQVIGFTDKDLVPRHQYLNGTWVVMPAVTSSRDKETKATLKALDQDSAAAIGALVKAMERTNKVAVVRWVRTKSSAVMLGVLAPWAATGGTWRPDCFVLNELPFREDLRNYKFLPLHTHPAGKVTPQQTAAARKLVETMDLTATGEEHLNPDTLSNPVLIRSVRVLANKAVDRKWKVPMVDELVESTFEPQLRWLGQGADEALNAMGEAFHTESAFRRSEQDQPGAKRPRFQDDGTELVDDAAAAPAPRVTTRAPVEEFEALLLWSQSAGSQAAAGSSGAAATTDSAADGAAGISGVASAAVASAFDQLRDVLHELVHTSTAHKFLAKALSCLSAMRTSAVRHAVPAPFNTTLMEVEERALQGIDEYPDLLRNLVEVGVKPIGDDECAASSMSGAQSAAWLARHRGDDATLVAPPVEADAAVDDEFEGME